MGGVGDNGQNQDLVIVGNDKKIHLYSKDGEFRRWSGVTRRLIREIESGTQLRLRTVEVVKVPKDHSIHSLVATGSSDGCVQVWDVYSESDNLLCDAKSSERLTCCSSLLL